MNNRAKILFACFPLIALFIFIGLHNIVDLNWKTSGGLVLIGISIGNIALFSAHLTAKLGQAQRLVVLNALVTLLLGIAITADGLWGSRWPFLDWAAGIAVLLQFVALRLLVRKFRMLAEANKVAGSAAT
jgi:hypothetical protein